jgi:hypothetical protein
MFSNGSGHKKFGTAKDYEFVCQLHLELILRPKNNKNDCCWNPWPTVLSKIPE